MQIPDRFRRVYSKADIHGALQEMSAPISAWCNEITVKTHREVLAIAILRGGLFFFADLVRTLSVSVEVQALRTMGYHNDQVGVPRGDLHIDLMDCDVAGRSILIVDDICDSGRTLGCLTAHLLRSGAREVRTAVLIQRQVPRPEFQPDWVAFNYTGEEWFVGYGMEELDRYRNLPEVHIITSTR